MNPPIVYDVTSPNNQSTIKTIAIVPNIGFSLRATKSALCASVFLCNCAQLPFVCRAMLKTSSWFQ